MKITPKLLQIPPFLSTSWDQVTSLYVQTKQDLPLLTVTLKDGAIVEVPHLTQKELDEIFQAHAHFANSGLTTSLLESTFSFTFPTKLDTLLLDSVASQLQHNPEQTNLPPIPSHILSKIIAILRSINPNGEEVLFDKAHPGCQCTSCQLARAAEGEKEEIVDVAELTFRDWEVSQKDQKLYDVVNPLDTNEHYTVFLGDPIGCTCGCKNCEHIRAVLHT